MTSNEVIDPRVDCRIDVPAPVLTLLSDADELWAGGAGGVAVRRGGHWRTFPGVGAVGLARLADGVVVAGGVDGIVRFERGDGPQAARISGGGYPVAALAGSATTAVAGTLGGGVLRSADSGRTWQSSNFGLTSLEVTALAWTGAESVLAGTAAGIHRSPNGGRAWRQVPGTEEICVAALTADADGLVVAVGEDGALHSSADDGRTWAPTGALPADAVPMSLHIASGGRLLAGTAHGIVCSDDGGRAWQRMYDDVGFCFAAADDAITAGVGGGLVESRDRGETWQPVDPPPVHDLARLTVVGAALFAWGSTAGLHRITDAGSVPLEDVPTPLTAVEAVGSTDLCVATPDWIWRMADTGSGCEQVSSAGGIGLLTFGADGRGWAARRDGTRMLRTEDAGRTWVDADVPWGKTELVALRCLPSGPLAATYDPAQLAVDLWRGDHAGGWTHASRASLPTPVVATCADPPVAVLGGAWMVVDRDGVWRRGTGPGGTIRAVRGRGDVVVALTDTAAALSTDRGRTWSEQSVPVPAAQVLDAAVVDGTVYLLLPGARVRGL